MSFSEWINKKKATQEAQEEKRKSNTLSATGNTITFSEWIDNKVASRVDESYINNFISDASNFLKSAEKDYSSIKWDNASSVYNSKYTEWDNLNRRKKIINIWLNNNKDRLDKKFYNSLSDSLSNYDKGSISVINTFESANEYYSQWETEDAYKDAVKAQEDYEAMVNFDLVAGQKEIEGLLNGDEITALKKNRDTLRNDIRLYNRGVRTTYKTSNDVKKAKGRLSQIEKKIEEIEKQADQKQVYWNNANRVQTGIKLHNDALNASDFEEYVQKGKGLDDGKVLWYIAKHNMNGNEVEAVRRYFTDGEVSSGRSDRTNMILSMTDKEVSIYNYYLGKYGKDKAEEYLKIIEESLNSQTATELYSEIEGNTARELYFGVVSGLDQFASGIENVFNTKDDYIPSSAIQMTSGLVREDLADDSIPIWYSFKTGEWEDKVLGSSLGQVGYDVINTTSNMLPSILASTVVGVINPTAGAVVGAGLMGASAAGNAYAEALNLGFDKGQARMYSTMVGGSEALLQYFLGGISKFGGKLAGKTITGFVNNLDNAFARVSLKLGTNMASEFTEEYLQEVLTPYFKNLALGTNEDIKLFSTEALYSGILGALSAGILEGGSTIVADVKTTKMGKKIQSVDGGVERLKKLGTTFAADTVAYQIADKVTEETGAYKIGLLLQEVGGTLSEQNVSDIVIELTKKGMDESSAKKIAKLYQEFLNGEMSLTDEQVETLESLDPLANVLRKSIIGRNSAVYQRSREYNDLVQLATEMESESKESSVPQTDTEATRPTNVPYSTEYIESVAKEYEVAGMSPEQAKIMAMAQLSESAEGKSLSAEEKAVESKFEVSADGKTINTKNDEIVTIKKIESVSDDGEANLTLNDGMVVKASDLSFGSDAEAIFIENIGNIKVGKNPIGTNSANALYHTAMNALKDKPNMTASEADSLIRGLIESYVYGTYNLGRSKLTTRDANGKAVLFAGELSQEQRQFAYELGTKDAMSKTEADQKVIDDLKAKADPNSKKKHLGKIIFEKGAEVDESTLTATQKANLDGIKLLAQISSVEFHVFRSDKEIGFKYTMADGTVVSANGWFVGGTNQIWVDLNAGNFGEGTMIRTAAHEISHYIKQWSPQKWTAMADLLMEEFAKNGVNTESMLNKQIAKIKRRYKANKKTMPSESVILDMAYEELVCDALADMLTDGSIVNFIAEVKAKDANLAKKILNAIKSLLKKWGLIIDDYKDRDLDTPEAQALSQLEDTFKKLQAMFQEAFMDANEAVSTIGARNLADFAEAKNTDGESLFQYRAMEADESTYRDMLRKWGKMTDSQINNLFVTIDKAMDIIKDNLEVLDYAWEADINDRAFSPVKPNSDSLYQVSLDFSTLCRKRLLQQTIQAQLQEALNQPLTREEGIAIRDALIVLQEEGRQIEVACALCYVESARMKSPAQIKKFLNNREAVIKDFFAGKADGSMKGKIKQAEVDARARLHKENPNGIKGKDGSTLDPRDASLKAMPKKYADEIRSAKKKAKQSYNPTAEEQRLINVAKGMTVSDFTSPEGLENLAKNYPVLFDAYTSYIRNATKSKGIESDTWWRAGDSQRIGDVLIANMNRENGLRSQSWSDFQVIHILDYIAATIELSTRNAKEQAYSKVPDYIELMGQTGVMLNMSLIPTRNFNGSLEYDSVEGMDYKRALELREKYPATAGTICIGIDNKQIQMLLADITIDYVIPYHKSGMAASIRKLMHIPTWSQYEEYQSESNLSDTEAKKNAEKYGVKLLDKSDPNYHKHTAFSEWFDPEVAKQIAKMENANPSNKAMQKKYGVMYGGYMAMQNAANNYLKLCAERGLAPKFSNEKADFTAEENYWKLLIDRKMVNNATGEIIEQQTIKPVFNETEVLRILNDELERYPSVKADQDYATRRVTEKFLSGEIKSGMSAEAIAKVMQKPVDNIAKTNIIASAKEIKAFDSSEERIAQNIRDVAEMSSVYDVDKSKLARTGKKPSDIFAEHFDRWGNRLYSDELGDIAVEKSSVKSEVRHGITAEKIASIEAIPTVIKEGKVIFTGMKPNSDVQRIVVCAPIKIGGTPYYMGVMLQRDTQTQRLYLHNVAIEKEASEISQADLLTTGADENSEYLFMTRILQNAMSVKYQNGRNMLSDKNTDVSEKLFSERDLVPTFYSQMGKVVEGVKQEKLAANSVVNMLRGKGVKAEEIRWSGIVPFLEGKKSVTKHELLDFINGSMLQIGEQMSSNNIDLRYDGSTHTYSLYDNNGNVVNTFKYNEFMGGYVSENDDEIYANAVELEDALREEYGSMSSPRWSQYKLDGGTNYRELVFTMPNSSYSNQMMRVHWGQDAEGVLVHARIQDFEANGKKMLFIEEIQSDWHNEGHKNGYESNQDAMQKKITDLEKQWYSLYYKMLELKKGQEQNDIIQMMDAIDEEKESLKKKVNYGTFVPDAPFKENYHEFVLKRLIRMAAEQGYDSIGWTTADIQSERWSDEFAEGYRIEYDQDMPKFLKKYGRQWGATVSHTALNNKSNRDTYTDNDGKQYKSVREWYDSVMDSYADKDMSVWTDYLAGLTKVIQVDNTMNIQLKRTGKILDEALHITTEPDTVWSMDITDSMRDSVLYEGQVMYSERDSEGNTLTKEQIDFFKDSKVRDEDGNLLVMYHGTDNGGFTIFDPSKSDDKISLFLTASKEMAQTYAISSKEISLDGTNNQSGIYSVYANIANPYVVDAKGSNWNKIRTGLNPFSQSTRDIAQKAKRKGYDGVIIKNLVDAGGYAFMSGEKVAPNTVVIAFDSNQIKSVDNANPTTDPDIRYSERDTAYMDAVNNGDMEKAQRMVEEAARKAGYDSPLLYHGTQAFGFTKVKTSGVEKGAEWSPFFAASKEDISATYVPYGKAREISSSMDDDAISEARENAIEEIKENITDLVGEFRRLIDRYFSEWVFGQTDNSRLEELVENANPEAGNGDGVYDVLSEIVYDTFYDYKEEFGEYEDADDWSENSPEGNEIFSKIVEIEGEKLALHRLELGEELGGIYQLYANLDNMYVVDGKGAAWNELRPEGLPKLERYGFKDVPYKTRDVAEWARDNGYDGVIFKNIRDNGAYGRTPAGDVYAFFKPESQVKSADPVTYDDNGNVIPLSERFNSKNNDIRYSERDIKPITEAEYKELESHFGTTGNFRVAGYLLTDGKLLDFSGKHWGDTKSMMRQVDHRDVQEVLDDRDNGFGAMIDMISNGNIRLMPETGGINLAVYPNEKQRRVLSVYINYMLNTEGQIIIDYDAVGGDTVYSKEYGRTATSKQILNDIRNYFNGGRQSELMQFHTMYQERDPSTSNRSILANSLESAAQNDIERNKLAQYKEKISLIEAEEQRLSEIQKQLFSKDAVEPAKRKELQFEAKQISNRINTYDRQLLNLEATTALKNVLNREKALAMKKQKQIDAEYLKQYKEKVQNDKKALVSKYQESRKKAVESRTKTAMRHKIKNVVNDLNNLLLKPSKERHVPEEMRIAVAEALALVNMDTVDADTRVAHYNGLIAKATDPDVIASLTETRDRILNQGNKLADKLTKLKDAYGMVRDSADDSLRSMYDDVIYNKIESVQKAVGKTPLRNMTLGQLESVYELYKMVLTTIRDSNKAFAENLTLTRQALGSNTFAEIKENNKVRDRIKHQFLEKSLWQNLKPMQAMKTIGSNTLQTLWNNILYGQEVFAQDYYEAVEFAKEMKDKHGYKKWNKDKLYSFESKSGKIMKLNLEQMMSIYAYSKRQQADEHIEYGGILLNESIIKEKNKLGKTVEIKVNDSTAYRLDRMQVGKIIETLEKEAPGAKNFVDEMQKYLSETMGNKGNEVSMKMYGVKLFKEEHYFPLKSSKDFMEAANAKLKGDVKIKNKGMTKSTVEHARTPIVLENFLDVWGNHINEMSMYHGLVLPLEDFSRTLNYSFKADDTLNTDAESVRTALHDAFGENADNYLNELLKAINGGVLHDSSAQFADKMISKFKKAKVMASLSVIVQQPTAIIRAMGIIEPKYFVAQNFNHKATWEELKTYCPTAIIKETGSFDTNMGRTIVDMIKDERGFTDKVGDFLGKAPAYMDEVGWNMIWRALKKKVATEQKLSGEELLKECGKQMTLIINETQVYDSVMSRNELMRSKNALTKMATAFMAEPSTVANMIYGATLDIKRGKKGIASKTIAATIGSVAINGLVSAMVYALRDDDEDETFLEKYLSSATTEVLDGLNPLTYIPFVKDAYSLFQGYKVERTDMALIKDVVEAIDDFYNVLDPEAYEGMSRKEIAQHIYDNSVPLLTSICDMFGLPVGNVLRDAEAIIINDNVPMSQTSSKAIGYAFEEGVLNTLPKIAQKVIGTDSKQDKLYDAIVDGDTAYVDRMKSGYKDEKAYEAAVRKALRDNDSRIREAAEARISGDIAEYARIVKEIKAEGFFSQDTIVASVNAEIGAINKGESSASKNSATENKESSIHTMDDYFASIVGGDQATAYVVKEDIIKTDVANGKDRDEAEDNFNSKFASHVREQYEDGYISDYDAEKMLVNYGGKSEQDAASKVQYWSFKQEYPDYDDLSEEAVDKYYNDVEPHGISIHVYYDYSKQRSKCKGTDKNGDGKTDSGSVKKEVLQVINSLPITKAQKDALYYINGWSSRTIYEAPWR